MLISMKSIEEISKKETGGRQVKLLDIVELSKYEMKALKTGPANNIHLSHNPQDVKYRIGIVNNLRIPKKEDGSLPDFYYAVSFRVGCRKDKPYKEKPTKVKFFEKV